MSNQRNLSLKPIDIVIKLSIDLKLELLEQLKLFESKILHLLPELKKLLEFKDNKIKNQNSILYLETNFNEIEKLIDLLSKLDEYNQFKKSSNLILKLNKIKDKLNMMLLNQLSSKFNYETTKLTNEEKNKKIFSLVFKELSIKDLLTCRLVSKQFKHSSDHTNGLNKLIIGQLGYTNDNYWYYNYKLIEAKDIISLKCFRTIQRLSIFNLDTNLKYLKIYDKQFKLKELSNLKSLESIEFGNGYENDNQQIINLNNLKVFVSSYCSVQLDTPKLEKIQFEDINKIKLNSKPESIKHLITRNYDNKLEIFKNLEIMELRDIYQPVDENLLINFKNLRQLKINLNLWENYSNESIKNSLIKILNDKVKLKRSIDIYLEGIKIENIDKFNQLVSNGDSYCKLILNNYDLLDLNIPFINELNYGELQRSVNNIKNDLPISFFDIFSNINYVKVDGVKDIDGLNWFLNKLKYLIALKIDVSLDEVFYNNLPNTIRELIIMDREDINYEFILKLPKLIYFYTKVDKDLFDVVFTSFLNLKYLNNFEFYYKKKIIKIEKNDQYFYLNDRRRELNYNQLIEECFKIRSNGLNCNLM